MNLYELGHEYLNEAKKLHARALELMEQLRSCDDDGERLMLKRRIYYLITETRDCRRIAEQLINYYERDDNIETAYSA